MRAIDKEGERTEVRGGRKRGRERGGIKRYLH